MGSRRWRRWSPGQSSGACVVNPFVAAITAGIGIYLVVGGVENRRRRGTIMELVDNNEATTSELPGMLRWMPKLQRGPLARVLAKRQAQQEKLEHMCILAQRPWGLTGAELDRLTWAGAIAWPLALGLGFAVIGSQAILGLVIGFFAAFIPRIVVTRRAEARSKAISAALPVLLDLLVMADQAGLTEIEALRVAASETGGALGNEIDKAIARITKVGGDVETVFAQLAADTQISALEDFAVTLSVSQQYGGATYSQAIASQADRLRAEHRQELEKRIGQLATLMIVPIGIFILPCILLLIVGPTIPTIFHALAGGGI